MNYRDRCFWNAAQILKQTRERFTIKEIAELSGYSIITLYRSNPQLWHYLRKSSIDSIANNRKECLSYERTEISFADIQQWIIAKLKKHKPFEMKDFYREFYVTTGWLRRRPQIYRSLMIAIAFSELFEMSTYRKSPEAMQDQKQAVEYVSSLIPEKVWEELSIFCGTDSGRTRDTQSMMYVAHLMGFRTNDPRFDWWNAVIEVLNVIRPYWRGGTYWERPQKWAIAHVMQVAANYKKGENKAA